MKLKKKVSIVTGAGSGIGEAIARRFFMEGSHLGLMDIDEGNLGRVSRELSSAETKTLAIQCDVTDERAVEESVHRIYREL